MASHDEQYNSNEWRDRVPPKSTPKPTSETFSERLAKAAEQSMLDHVTRGNWLAPDYAARFKIPAEWLAECWAAIDPDRLKQKLAERVESELVDRIVNHMAAELATDIKQILSVQERREKIRAIARDHLDHIMKG